MDSFGNRLVYLHLSENLIEPEATMPGGRTSLPFLPLSLSLSLLSWIVRANNADNGGGAAFQIQSGAALMPWQDAWTGVQTDGRTDGRTDREEETIGGRNIKSAAKRRSKVCRPPRRRTAASNANATAITVRRAITDSPDSWRPHSIAHTLHHRLLRGSPVFEMLSILPHPTRVSRPRRDNALQERTLPTTYSGKGVLARSALNPIPLAQPELC